MLLWLFESSITRGTRGSTVPNIYTVENKYLEYIRTIPGDTTPESLFREYMRVTDGNKD